jgi:hypothetical protein
MMHTWRNLKNRKEENQNGLHSSVYTLRGLGIMLFFLYYCLAGKLTWNTAAGLVLMSTWVTKPSADNSHMPPSLVCTGALLSVPSSPKSPVYCNVLYTPLFHQELKAPREPCKSTPMSPARLSPWAGTEAFSYYFPRAQCRAWRGVGT